MSSYENLDKIAINVKSHRLLSKLLNENPKLEKIMNQSKNETEALVGVKEWVLHELKKNETAYRYYQGQLKGAENLAQLQWSDYAAIRILDYIDNAGREFRDLNLRGKVAVSNPIKLIWLGVHMGTGGAKPFFYQDMLHLFQQFSGKKERNPVTRAELVKWMDRYPSGLDPRIVRLREENRERIIKILIKKMDSGEIHSQRYQFKENLSEEQKFLTMLEWWKEMTFHMTFAVRSPDLLNELLDFSLDPDTMEILYQAEKKKIPFFVNPYYLSLLHVRVPYFAIGADLAIRYYILYSQELIHEFGHIVAWEREDEVKPGEPNAAGWILPSDHNIHRRYPDVAILIPDTVGRACGGLCSSCQRMYNFQRGLLNFDLKKLEPHKSWSEKLPELINYWRMDSQLRDILITGGDGLMSSNQSLQEIFAEILVMARRKHEDNQKRKDHEKHAEIQRIRIGTRLPVYLPQRITPDLIKILKDFKDEGSQLGIRQFVIQTHFEAPMEVTPEAKLAIERLISAGWVVTNQTVFTVFASRRGHNAKLRKVLNDLGVLAYYTFTVKGYMENFHNFAPNSRSVQESAEEKSFGTIPEYMQNELQDNMASPEKIPQIIQGIKNKTQIPFLSTDRNVLNLPGVGKSLTFRTIGITRYGRRILEFDHDRTRKHSPIIEKMGKVVIIESKSIAEYLKQLEDVGEDMSEYDDLYGYSIGETEARNPIFEYPDYDFFTTDEMTNLKI
ncbi:MAG: KamA family protein [Candidatus Marinimicrobia bacterium]|nr:KamA family protein [Candidatus Neomarinimicrobiota bacterium]